MTRLAKLRQKMEERGLPAILITMPENRRYISGFTGSSAYLFITDDDALLATDFRYTEQAATQAPGFEVVMHKSPATDTFKEILRRFGVTRLGFEKDQVTYSDYETLREALTGVELIGTSGLVEELRMVKDANELDKIRRAVAIGDSAFKHMLQFLRPGLTEKEVAFELEFFMRKTGADGLAFSVIAASGPNSALPHAVPTDRVLQPGDFVKIDYGCKIDGYCSDMTRTVVLGQATEKQREVYDIVLRAQLAAVAAVRPGMTGADLDAVARQIITEAGYGDNFGHGLGHGVGLQVHEGPGAGSRSTTVFEPGMVITIEPGIYLPGWGGVRIEDMAFITADGAEIPTASTKELLII